MIDVSAGAAAPGRSSDELNVLCDRLKNVRILTSDSEFLASYELGEEIGRGGWA